MKLNNDNVFERDTDENTYLNNPWFASYDIGDSDVNPEEQQGLDYKYALELHQILNGNINELRSVDKNDNIDQIDDPWHINIHGLFCEYNAQYFNNDLNAVSVMWSNRMTTAAGVCYCRRSKLQTQGESLINKDIKIHLSAPLLQFRPIDDLHSTLLHEMIHAYLFFHSIPDDHGPNFLSHAARITAQSGFNITIYHTFHDETNYFSSTYKCNKCAQIKQCNASPAYMHRKFTNCTGKMEKIKDSQAAIDAKLKKNNAKKQQYEKSKDSNITNENVNKITDLFPKIGKTKASDKNDRNSSNEKSFISNPSNSNSELSSSVKSKNSKSREQKLILEVKKNRSINDEIPTSIKDYLIRLDSIKKADILIGNFTHPNKGVDVDDNVEGNEKNNNHMLIVKNNLCKDDIITINLEENSYSPVRASQSENRQNYGQNLKDEIFETNNQTIGSILHLEKKKCDASLQTIQESLSEIRREQLIRFNEQQKKPQGSYMGKRPKIS